jgi:hypothetical protein
MVFCRERPASECSFRIIDGIFRVSMPRRSVFDPQYSAFYSGSFGVKRFISTLFIDISNRKGAKMEYSHMGRMLGFEE